MIGKTVGNYRILERLGRGGMGIVYKALDETLDREVAIKVLNPDLGEADLLKRFRAEAISLARLNHPGIATIYELRQHDDELLMVMEFVRGETLQALSERLGPLDPPQAAHICIQVLDALAHAHRAGIIHRDLKPANVMMTDTGVVKVMDFGIARMMGGEHFTHAGYMMGTPAYMAPEQVLGQEIDGRADLYSVGVLFYRLLSRELPFQADTAISMAQKQVADPPTPITMFRPDLPSWCEAVISKALAKAPSARFQSSEEFRAALRTAVTPATLGELPTMATPTAAGLLRTSDLTLAQPTGSVSDAGPTMPDLRRGPGNAPSGTSPVPATAPLATAAAAAAGTTGTAPIERTGTSVVLGGSHLVGLAALLLVLIAGIAVLGFAAFRRGESGAPAAATPPPASSETVAAAPPAQDPQPAPVPQPPDLAQTPAVTTPPPSVPAPTTPTSGSTTPSSSAAVPAEGATRRAKPPAPKVSEAPAPADPVPAPAAAPPVTTPAEPAAPAVPTATFDDLKVLVPQGKNMRDRDAVLKLAGDHLSIMDKSGQSEIRSVPYASVVQAYYSRSKEPRWKGPDGKDAVASVDLGRMSFFRGDRNWLILLTNADPVFIRFEDGGLRTLLPKVEERLGLKIQR